MYRYHCAFNALRAFGRTLAPGIVAVVLGVAGAANTAFAVTMPVTIDFETDGNGAPLAPGTFITNEWENLDISVSSTNGSLRLFNSNCVPGVSCTGGDDDLASGADFGNGFVPAQGNVLIRQDPPDTDSPGDTAAAGIIRFDFDKRVRLISIALLDNDNGPGITLNIFKNGSAEPGILIPDVDFENSFQTFMFAGDANWVTALEVAFPSSGAIASLSVTPAPIPAALPLLLSALAWLGWVARRRRRIVA